MDSEPDDGPFFIDIEDGLVDIGEVDKSYWNTDMQEEGVGDGDDTGANGKTTSEMTTQETFEEWDFEEVWTIQEEESYPYFAWAPDIPYIEDIDYILTMLDPGVDFDVTLNPPVGEHEYEEGTHVDISVTGYPDWVEFSHWLVNNEEYSTSSEDELIIDGTKEVKAIFEEETDHDLTIDSTDGGEVTNPGEDAFTYNEGTVVDLVATSDADHDFVNWTGDVETIADVNAVSTTITMDTDYTITANFVIETGQPGDVNSDGKVDASDLTAVADNFNQTGDNDADLNGDGIVDIFDLVEVGRNFGSGE
ncbi:MAG: InlB B-repeat-containing protein [Chloroflexota bacterium]